MFYLKILSILLTILLAVTCPAASQISTTFDSNLEGWMAADINPVTHQTTVSLSDSANWSPNGNPGGCLQIDDVYYWTFIAAPSAYLGNWEHGYGKQLTYDILIIYTDNVSYPAVAIRGETTTLYYNTPSPPVGQWVTMEIPLEAGQWRLNSYTSAIFASEQQIREVLSSVRGFYILTEWNTGPDDTRVDNISLSFAPPSTTQTIYGISGRSLSQEPAIGNQLNIGFRVWGRVMSMSANSATLSDGSGVDVVIRDDSLTGISVGDFVQASGILNPLYSSPTIDILPGSLIILD